MNEATKKCVVVGGGLAGLISARNLAKQGWSVKVLEATTLLGGKARAEQRDNFPVLIEHGYHVFPTWYENIRDLFDEINAEVAEDPKAKRLELVDFRGFYYLEPGGKFHRVDSPVRRGATRWETFKLTLRSVRTNLFRGLNPWYIQYLFAISVIDILRKPFTDRMMDSVSQVGFLRNKRYATEGLAKLNQENMLKASAIPAYEMSAMTAYRIGGYWVRQPDPFLSILPGDLQTCFIDPIVESCKRHKVSFEFQKKVAKLDMETVNEKTYVRAILDEAGNELASVGRDVSCIVTTPFEVTRKLIDSRVYRADPELGNLEHLQTEPMSALHLFVDLSAKELGIDEMPEHIFMTGSHYGLSFLDNTQTWGEFSGAAEGCTYLSFISSNFSPLRAIETDEERFKLLLEEICEYLPKLTPDKVRHWFLNGNLEVPLYINTVGSWGNRPRVDTAIPNLFLAGDYVKNDIDLACMEGAVFSAMEAANLICDEAPKPRTAPRYSGATMSWLYLAARLFPGTWLAIALARRDERRRRRRPAERLSRAKVNATRRLRAPDWRQPLPPHDRSPERSGTFPKQSASTDSADKKAGEK